MGMDTRISARPASTAPVHAFRTAVGLVAALLLGAVGAFAAMTGSGPYPPPATGTFAYNSFVPAPSAGTVYVDPVFGETVRRLTADHGIDDIYARNMWWSADERRYLHRTYGVPGKSDNWDVVDVASGAVTHTGIPFGTFAADGGFDPIDPDVLYYLVGNRGDGRGEIHQVRLGSGGTWTDTVYFTAPGVLGELGGSMNWLDASGRYMIVRYGAEPSVRVYDRQNLAAGPYANPIDGRNYIDPGAYLGLSPDGKFVVGYDGRAVGFARAGQGVSWRLDHANRAVASAPNVFWSLCGDHGSFLSASDGGSYMITYDCYSQAGLWRVDISNNADGLNEAQQQSLPNNKLLMALPTWNDFGHVSTVARGTLRDWAFVSSEDSTDLANSGTADAGGSITPWHSYRQEIMAVNVLTGEVRRLAHHGSRSMGGDYYSQPRLSASWGGAYVAFPSNFNKPGVVDIYAVAFAAPPPANPSSTYPITVTKAGTGKGTVTSSPTGITCGSACSATFTGGAAVTLTATPAYGFTFDGWSGACSGSGTCTVLANAPTSAVATFTAPPPVTVSITSPTALTTLSGTVQVTASALAVAGVANVQFNLDGANLGGKDKSAPYSVSWDTTRASNGVHRLTAIATTKTGVSATAAAITVTVTNPSITAVSASGISSSGSTINWTTSEGSDSQVDYGTTTSYGASTTLNTARVTSHVQALTGLQPGTLYHYRVRSRNASGNLAVSGDFTFTTTGAASGGSGGSTQTVVWTSVVNATASGGSLQKTSGCGGCADAGGISQQQIASGNGYVQFTATQTAPLRFVGLSRGAVGTEATSINFAIRLQSGNAEVRENGTYRSETTFVVGDVFRVAVESGVVKYLKNGSVFYTSGTPPVYPLQADASLLDLGSAVDSAVISF